MKVYKEVSVKGKKDLLIEFSKSIVEYLNDNWKVEKQEARFSEYLELTYTGTLMPKATVFLYTYRYEREYIKVVNIIPIEKNELNYDEYNSLLTECYELLLEPCAKNVGLKINITSDQVNMRIYMTKESEEKLKRFSNSANKSTGSGHPLDKKRWNDFICQSYIDGSKRTSEILERWLIEEENWSEDVAYKLAIEYEQGIELLGYFMENYIND